MTRLLYCMYKCYASPEDVSVSKIHDNKIPSNPNGLLLRKIAFSIQHAPKAFMSRNFTF